EPEPKRAPPPPRQPPKPKPKPNIRDAKPSDAQRLAELIHELGHEITDKQVRKNLEALKKSGETPLVAALDKKVVGMCGISRRVAAIEVVDAQHFGLTFGGEASQDQAHRGAQVGGHDVRAGQSLDPVDDRRAAVNVDVRAHAAKFGDVHVAVLEDRLLEEAVA